MPLMRLAKSLVWCNFNQMYDLHKEIILYNFRVKDFYVISGGDLGLCMTDVGTIQMNILKEL